METPITVHKDGTLEYRRIGKKFVTSIAVTSNNVKSIWCLNENIKAK